MASIARPVRVLEIESRDAGHLTFMAAQRTANCGVGTLHNPPVRKTDAVKTRSTTVHLTVELAQKLAVHCAMSGRKQSEVIAEAVESLLN